MNIHPFAKVINSDEGPLLGLSEARAGKHNIRKKRYLTNIFPPLIPHSS